MNKLLIVILTFTLLIEGCSTPKANKKSNNDLNKMEFVVSKIKNEKDGQTISMKDEKGGKYITIISPANGNFVKLKIGDKISLVAKEIMESNPVQIISKDIKVLSSISSNNIEYEKVEEEIYWIDARKTTGYNMHGNPTECFNYQKGNSSIKASDWKILCDNITHFDYVEGYFYKIKVLKKWLKNHKNLADRSPFDLELKTVISKEKDSTYINPIKSIISTDKNKYKVGEPIFISLELKNTANKPYTFLPWGTPIEKSFTRDCLKITKDGKTISYTGIMVKRIPPTEKDYITIKAGESVSGKANLLKGYALKNGNYKIQFKETYKGLPASNIIDITIKLKTE